MIELVLVFSALGLGVTMGLVGGYVLGIWAQTRRQGYDSFAQGYREGRYQTLETRRRGEDNAPSDKPKGGISFNV